ncbi:hypothetical protein ABI59_09920 [Acidobacteria bacterium Mor1]|nr:hypothetical protein ABI59_09920 [Acidobacteria bacterium Mor1]
MVSIIAFCVAASAAEFDLVINNGRVIDPETSLDAIRHVGIRGDTIAEVSRHPLDGTQVIDARGKVVSPGFIDRNTYVLGEELFRLRASDGVTTTFNFEEGAYDVASAYAAHAGRARIHYGFSVSDGAVRMALASADALVVKDGIATLPEGLTEDESSAINAHQLDDDQLQQLLREVEAGFVAGAPAVGMGPEYFPGATEDEALHVFRLAARYGRSVQIHARAWDPRRQHARINEVISGALVTGASIHLSHLNSITTDHFDLYHEMISDAQALGLSVTTECYPYTAGQTWIGSAMFDDWRDWPDERFADFEWPVTGKRLDRASFGRYRQEGGLVIIHAGPRKESVIEACMRSSHAQIASDGGADGPASHPRVAGTNTRVLGRYVREKGLLTLSQAIAKMSLFPARSLERIAPQMGRKGRLQPGMDADVVIFDPARVIDRATYREPLREPAGMEVVIVAGTVVKQGGHFVDDAYPGLAIRVGGQGGAR